MSFNIPTYIEPQVQQFAHAQHISADEAVVRLIEAGLSMVNAKPANRSILGAFADPVDSAVMDEALELAMRERRHAQRLAAADSIRKLATEIQGKGVVDELIADKHAGHKY